MRRSTAKVKILAGAIGLILALPFSFASTAGAQERATTVSSLAAFSSAASILDAWRDYALADLGAGFSWTTEQSPEQAAPSLLQRATGQVAPPVSHFAGSLQPVSPLRVTFMTANVADTAALQPSASSGPLQDLHPGIQRYIVAPSFSQRWGDDSAVSVSAIFAYQRFAGLGLGQAAVPLQAEVPSNSAPASLRQYPGSYGTGMRVDFNNRLTDRLSWQVGYQSRVNMDAFNNYRGVYSEPGSFDIPASADFGLGYALTPDFKIDLGLQRVMYSHIAPFTSDALPTRFLVLLGSSISPSFAWQDLDVYSLGWSWRDPGDSLWSVHYSTREQPLPTSPLLRNVLEPYLASHDVEFRFAHGFGGHSDLRLAATYAPAQFVLGLPTSNSLRSDGGSQIEYEATWTTRF